MSDRKIQVGLIGCGTIVRETHLPALQQAQHAKAVALCDVDQRRLEDLGGEFKIDRLYNDYRRLIDDPDVEAVVVALPPFLNREVVGHAAERGRHVLVEKPIANSLEDAEAIIDACSRAGVKLCVNHQRRFSECERKAIELIHDGAIGELVHVRVAFLADALESYQADDTWQFAPEGGIWIYWAVHLSDLMRYLTDDEIDRIYLEKGSRLQQAGKGPESAFALVRTKNRIVGEIQVSTVRRRPFDRLAGKFVPHVEETEICGSTGSILYSRQTGSMAVCAAGGGEPETETFAFEPNTRGYASNMIEMARLMHDGFAEAITGNSRPPVTGEDGYKALQVIIAGDKSAELREAVHIH